MNELLNKIAGGMIIGGMAIIGYVIYEDERLIRKYHKNLKDADQLIELYQLWDKVNEARIQNLEKELEELKAKEAES